MVRVIAVAGTGCVAETMRSRMGAPEPYSLSVAQNPHKTTVTLKSASGAYACTFAPSADAAGLSTYGRPGYYTCEPFTMEFRCSDGTLHTIFTMGQDIAVRLSGDGVSGEWDAAWFEAEDWVGTEMKAQFTGGR